jgi:hypothetical protein
MNYILNGHNSFYIREGWLGKGYTFIKENPEIDSKTFSKTNIDTIDKLGLGGMMVSSLKFWMQSFGIIEKIDKNKWVLSDIADKIFEKDKYLQNNNNLWLLHYNLLKDKKEKQLYWYLIFEKNKNLNIFTREELFEIAKNHFKEQGKEASEKTLKDGINILIKTYLNETNKSNDPEDNLFSPFSRLNYLVKNNDIYRFRNIDSSEIAHQLIIYILLDQLKEQKFISVEDSYNLIKVYIKMNYIEFEKIISKLENESYIKVDRASGLDNIILEEKLIKSEILDEIVESESAL